MTRKMAMATGGLKVILNFRPPPQGPDKVSE